MESRGGTLYFIPKNIELHPDLKDPGFLRCAYRNPGKDSVEDRYQYVYPWIVNNSSLQMNCSYRLYNLMELYKASIVCDGFSSKYNHFGVENFYFRTPIDPSESFEIKMFDALPQYPMGSPVAIKVHKYVFATNVQDDETIHYDNVPPEFTNLCRRYPKITDEKIRILQNFCKNNLMYWRIKRRIKSREFNKWIYSSENIGGKLSKKQLQHFVEEL